MPRNYPDWLGAYCEYASYSESPRRMHFWTGVSTIAGALRRRVWLDMRYFIWTPCFYILLVAPPGIVSKSTTAGVGMDLLRKVPGIKFGPQAVTWPALVTAFANSCEQFEFESEWHTQCALTLESSELGNLINPDDREMIDLLVTLWDSKQGGFTKVTKGSGTDEVVNPWINMIACTTPAWIAGNFPEYMIGGGWTSRCLFVYADKKDKLQAYPYKYVPANHAECRIKLIQDLEHIAINLVGPFTLTREAEVWGEAWYERHYKHPPKHLEDERFAGYLARKQTHLHKLAMILSASRSDTKIIDAEDLILGETMLTDLERDMPKVFQKIGRTETSVQAERFIEYIRINSPVSYTTAYHFIHAQFPSFREFESICAGAIRAGYISCTQEGTDMILRYIKKPTEPPGINNQ